MSLDLVVAAALSDAPAADRARALLYRAELAVRVGDDRLARSSLGAAGAVELDAREREALRPDVAHVEALLGARDALYRPSAPSRRRPCVGR